MHKYTLTPVNGKKTIAVPVTAKNSYKPKKQAFTPALDIHVNNAVTNCKNEPLELSEFLQEVRDKKYKLRAQIGELFKRVEPCGRYRTSLDYKTIPVVRTKNNTVSFHGLQTCQSVWACPVCAFKIMAKRAVELQKMFETAINKGYYLGFLTLTIPHRLRERLTSLHGLISETWRGITNDTRYKGQKKYKGSASDNSLKYRYGIAGFVSAREVKHGFNGWHPHLHIVLAFNKKPVDPDTGYALPLEELGEELINLWSEIILKKSGKSVNRQACDFQVSTTTQQLSEYLLKSGKWTLAKELTQAHAKTDKHPNEALKSYTPFELIELYFEDTKKHAKNLTLFTEFIEASHRQKALTFSKGFKTLFAPAEQLTDEQICNEELDTVLLEVETLLHQSMVQKYIDGQLLNIVEYHPEKLPDFMDRHYKNRYTITQSDSGNTLLSYTENALEAIKAEKQKKQSGIKYSNTVKKIGIQTHSQ